MKRVNLAITIIFLSVIISGCFSIFPTASKLVISAKNSVYFVGDKVSICTYIENSDKSIKNVEGEIYINGEKQNTDVFIPTEAGKYSITSKYNDMESNVITIDVQDFLITLKSDKDITTYKLGDTARFSYTVKDKNGLEKQGIVCDLYEGNTKLSDNTFKFEERRNYLFSVKFNKTQSNVLTKTFPLPSKIEIKANNSIGQYWLGESITFSAVVFGTDGSIIEEAQPDLYDSTGKKVVGQITADTTGEIAVTSQYKNIVSQTFKVEVLADPYRIELFTNKTSTIIEQDDVVTFSAIAYDKNNIEIKSKRIEIFANGDLIDGSKYSVTKSGINVITAKYKNIVSNEITYDATQPPKRIFNIADLDITANQGEFIEAEISVSGMDIKGYGIEVSVLYDKEYFDYDDVSDSGKHAAKMISSSVDGKIWGMKVIKEDEEGKVIIAAIGMDYGTTITGGIIKLPLKVRAKKGNTQLTLQRANILRGDMKGYMSNVDFTDVGVINIQ